MGLKRDKQDLLDINGLEMNSPDNLSSVYESNPKEPNDTFNLLKKNLVSRR